MTRDIKQRGADWLSVGFVMLFAYTATQKLMAFSTFRWLLSGTPLIGTASSLFVWLVPVAEYLLVLLWIIPKWRKAAFFGAMLMLLLFTAYIAYLLLFQSKPPCPCGGMFSRLSWPSHLLVNLCLMMLTFLGWQWVGNDGLCHSKHRYINTDIRLNQLQRFIRINRSR